MGQEERSPYAIELLDFYAPSVPFFFLVTHTTTHTTRLTKKIRKKRRIPFENN